MWKCFLEHVIWQILKAFRAKLLPNMSTGKNTYFKRTRILLILVGPVLTERYSTIPYSESDVDDWFMLVIDSGCWWQNHYMGDFFRYVDDFLNVLNQSSTSWIGHQHLKLVTNTFGLQDPSPTPMNYFLLKCFWEKI